MSLTLGPARPHARTALQRWIATLCAAVLAFCAVALTAASASASAVLELAPQLLVEPRDVSALEGGSAEFTVRVSGSPTPEVRWQRSGDGVTWTDVDDETEARLSISPVHASHEGAQYRAVASNGVGDPAISGVATLTVVVPEAPATEEALDEGSLDTEAPDEDAADSTEDAEPLAIAEESAAPNPAADYVSPVDPTVTYAIPDSASQGEPIVVSGTGWLANDGGGSVVGVLLDARFSGDPATVFTRHEVVNPVTGLVSTDKRLHAIVRADAQGSWSVEIPFPTPETAFHGYQAGEPAIGEWAAGSVHQVRLLTGSLHPNDEIRSLAGALTVAGDSSTGAAEAPAWPHAEVSYTDSGTSRTATAWVSSEIDAGDGASIRIKGSGWTNQADEAASTIALKINYGDGRQYVRTGDDVIVHPSASGDDTIWTLLAPENPTGHPHVVEIDADGDFEIEIDAPTGLQAGQYLSVLFQSGRFDEADVLRTATTDFLTVGGVPYEDADGGEALVTCVPGVPAPTVDFPEGTVALGGLLRVTGQGWCHPGELRGGSVIAVKIDEGAYSHLTDELHQNRTIWAIVEANPADGSFDVEIQLPDGTASLPGGSDPALPEGAHTLRLLTGSLKTGDAVRTLESGQFVVGAYSPNGTPRPVEAREELTEASRGGLLIAHGSEAVTVTIPGAAEGAWVFLTAYTPDGSPRYPWGATWFQADARGQVRAPVADAVLPAGASRLVAQSGDQGRFGDLLGWGEIQVAAPTEPEASPPTPPPADAGTSGSSTPARRVTPQVATTAAQPTTVPSAPVASADELTTDNVGTVSAEQDGGLVTITVAGAEPGSWVYLYAYTGGEPIPGGWIQLDGNRQLTLDISLLGPGLHKFALLGANGALLGWAAATVTADEEPTPHQEPTEEASAPASVTAALTPPDPVSSGGLGLSDADLWLLGAGALLVAVTAGGALGVRARRA